MAAYELAIQNFAVAEHLLQLYELFHGIREVAPDEEMRLAVCRRLRLPENAAIRHAENEQMVMCARATAPIPQALLIDGGIAFLLRQTVIAACTSLESFFWDSLRENVLTIVRARRRGADKSLRDLTLTLDDYLSMENYADPDERLRQIILKNFERRTLYDSESIEKIASVLTVRGFWDEAGKRCGRIARDLRRELDELITRRNQIAHRADRPESGEEQDEHGLRMIHSAWVRSRLATARSLVDASNVIFTETIRAMQDQLARNQEQQLAKQTLQPAATFTAPLQAVPVAPTLEPIPAPIAPAPGPAAGESSP